MIIIYCWEIDEYFDHNVGAETILDKTYSFEIFEFTKVNKTLITEVKLI